MSETIKEEKKKEIIKEENAIGFVDRIMDSLDGFGTKILSGRFLATLLLVWTYCKVVDTCCKLVEVKAISAETFLAVLAGIAGLVTMIVKDYFNRENKTGV